MSTVEMIRYEIKHRVNVLDIYKLHSNVIDVSGNES